MIKINNGIYNQLTENKPNSDRKYIIEVIFHGESKGKIIDIFGVEYHSINFAKEIAEYLPGSYYLRCVDCFTYEKNDIVFIGENIEIQKKIKK